MPMMCPSQPAIAKGSSGADHLHLRCPSPRACFRVDGGTAVSFCFLSANATQWRIDGQFIRLTASTPTRGAELGRPKRLINHASRADRTRSTARPPCLFMLTSTNRAQCLAGANSRISAGRHSDWKRHHELHDSMRRPHGGSPYAGQLGFARINRS